MFYRGWFRLRLLCISLILSGPAAHAGDFTLSLVKNVGNWASKNIGNILKGAGAGVMVYNAQNYDPDTGVFNLPSDNGISDMGSMRETMNHRMMENRGMAVGTTGSDTYEAPRNSRINNDQAIGLMTGHVQQKATGMTLKQLEREIVDREQALRQDRKDAKRNKNRDASYDRHAQQQEAELAALKAENKGRRVSNKTFVHSMSDEELDKNIRNFTEKLVDAEEAYNEATKPDWFGRREDGIVEKNQVNTVANMLGKYKSEKENRLKGKVVTTTATAMILSTKTTGTNNTNKMERTPEDGNGSAPDPEKPDKDPRKIIGRGIGMTAVGEGAKEVAEEALKNMGKKPHGESHTNPKQEKSLADHKANEQKILDDAQKALREARKEAGRQMNSDPQPFHEKGLEVKFPQNPGQKIHQIEDRAGHFKEFTPAVEDAVRSTVKKEHFDYVDNGNSRYTQEVKGVQVWVEVRPDGTIKNFGGNEVFHTKNPVTGRYDKPEDYKRDGPGVALGVALAGALGTGNEIQANEPIKLSNATLKALGINPAVADRIKNDPNPLKLPDVPQDNFLNSVTVSPEMKALTEHRLGQIKTLSTKEQMTATFKITPTTPVIKLPSSTSSSSGSGQTALPVLQSSSASKTYKSSTTMPSAPPRSRATYSAPKSSSSNSGFRAPTSGYGTRGGGPPPAFGKRN